MADRMVEAGTAIVTGGAGGIGKATVRRLLDMGLSVFIVDVDEKSLDTILSEFGAVSGRLDGCRADVTNESQVMQAVSRAAERFGNIYALVHVAGGAGPKRARDIEDFQLREWAHVIDLNLTSAFLAARAVVPLIVGTYAAYIGATVWTDYFNIDVTPLLREVLDACDFGTEFFTPGRSHKGAVFSGPCNSDDWWQVLFAHANKLAKRVAIPSGQGGSSRFRDTMATWLSAHCEPVAASWLAGHMSGEGKAVTRRHYVDHHKRGDAMKPDLGEVADAAAILLAAQRAKWGPIQHAGELHDRATYRYFWELLQKAKVTGVALPEEAAEAFF